MSKSSKPKDPSAVDLGRKGGLAAGKRPKAVRVAHARHAAVEGWKKRRAANPQS